MSQILHFVIYFMVEAKFCMLVNFLLSLILWNIETGLCLHFSLLLWHIYNWELCSQTFAYLLCIRDVSVGMELPLSKLLLFRQQICFVSDIWSKALLFMLLLHAKLLWKRFRWLQYTGICRISMTVVSVTWKLYHKHQTVLQGKLLLKLLNWNDTDYY